MIKISKPWGHYCSLDDGTTSNGLYQIKTLVIKQGHRLSLQSHEHRKEYWLVVDGNPTIELGDSKQDYFIGDLITIRPKQKHRIANNYSNDVIIVEVQLGSYLGEDDIVRYEDDYNRDPVEELKRIQQETDDQSNV